MLVVIAGLATFAQSGAGQRELRRAGIVAAPPAFTELAFQNPARLPNTVSRRPRAVLLPFTITNRGRRDATYAWRVVVTGNSPRVLRSGSVPVAAGQAVTIVPSLELACTTRTRVNVVLSSGESIGLWATCVRRPPAGRR